jgi:type II secretory pathway component PulJ
MILWAPRYRPRSSDQGLTLVELMVALFGLGILGMVMVGVFVATNRVDHQHEADDRAMAELQTAQGLITKDLRRAERLTVIAEKTVTMWIDESRDGTADDGELVSWVVETDGDLARSTDTGVYGVLATRLSYADSGFAYDSSYPDLARRVSVHLAAVVLSPGVGGERYVATEVFLRNHS